MSTFGQRLRGLRERAELTQRDLAKRLSLVSSTISQWESDKRAPDSATLQRLADIFGVSVDYLLGRVDEASVSPAPPSDPDLPGWVSNLPTDMQQFVAEESKSGWPYLRLARGLKMQDLSPAELQAIVETWMDARKRYEKEFGRRH